MSAELEDLIEEAEDQKEKFSKVQERTKKVKDQLRERVKELSEEDILSAWEFDKALHQIDNAEYGKVRETIREAEQGTSFEFDDEEKEAFAEGFKDSWEELEEKIEEVRNVLLALTDGASRQDQKDMVYARNSSMTKSEIDDIFSAIDKLTTSGTSTKKIARCLSGMKSNVTVSDAETVLEEIKKEAGK